MRRIFLVAAFAGMAIGCGSDPTGATPPPPPPPPPGDAPVATVTVSNVPSEMETGKSTLAGVTLRSASGATLAGRNIAWSSSNSDVAAVTLSGMVHANNPGTTMITATSEGKTGSATLKVDTRNGYLTAIVESVREQYALPAMAGVIVTRTGGTFGAGVSGRRRNSQATPVTVNDLWHIGSNLKAITAHVAGIAVGEGKITWTTTLAQAYPALSGSMRAEYRNVTLRQLLGHIGGIAPNIENVALAGTGTLTAQRANLAAWATSVAPTGGGVGTYTYSNVGYMIAANMVERAVGASWEDYQQAKLLVPLGATAFGWGPANPAQQPVGHQRSGNTWTEFPNSDNPPFLSSAGRSHWSMDSYAKVLQDIMKADQGQSALVPQAVARINTTSQSSANYASGWAINNGASWAGGRGVEHDGSNNLNYTRTQIALDRGVAVVATTNSHDTGSNRSNDAMVALTTRLWAYYTANGN